MSAASYEIQGRTIRVPVRVRDGDSWSAQFLVPGSAAQALVAPAGLQALRLLPRRAALIVSFASYRDSDLGPYEEVAITFLVRRRHASAHPVMDRRHTASRGELGIYMHRLAQSQPLAVETSRRIWGYPSFLADIQIEASHGHGRVVCSVARGGRQLLRISQRQGGVLKLTDPNLPNYSLHDGLLRVSEWNQIGKAHTRMGGARLELGSDPIADELRLPRLPERALMSATMRHMKAEFGSSSTVEPPRSPAATPGET